MYSLEIKPEADRIFSKLAKKNPNQLMIIDKKIKEIRQNPYNYKFLRNPLQGFNRVHIDKHFVLVFKINDERKVVTIYYFAHHDSVYKWKPKTEG
jgi:YafQ family addiction module toxin component